MARTAIYRIPDGDSAPEVWLESDALDGPNGLSLDGHRLMVAAFGTRATDLGEIPHAADLGLP